MIQDSGERRKFETGAVRDIQEGKGRCDLLPLSVVAQLFSEETLLHHFFMALDSFHEDGKVSDLLKAIAISADIFGMEFGEAMMEVSKHYEEGCHKYGERNWEKGIPIHCYIDSAIRHMLKYYDDWEDERHDRAVIWNLLGAAWTIQNKPELDDFCKQRRLY